METSGYGASHQASQRSTEDQLPGWKAESACNQWDVWHPKRNSMQASYWRVQCITLEVTGSLKSCLKVSWGGDLLWEVQASASESAKESLRITDVQASHLSCSVVHTCTAVHKVTFKWNRDFKWVIMSFCRGWTGSCEFGSKICLGGGP